MPSGEAVAPGDSVASAVGLGDPAPFSARALPDASSTTPSSSKLSGVGLGVGEGV